MREKRLVEAALFMSSRKLSLEELRKLTGIGALGYLEKVVRELAEEYSERGSAIEIVAEDGGYIMRVKAEYIEEVKDFAREAELSKSALRTLAYLSKHEGMLKSELVKRLGSGVYADVKELVKAGFVKERKSGRSSKLLLTEKFRRMFKVK